jgi:hypothetical protein
MKLKKSLIYGLGILCLTCFASAQEGERKGPPPEGGRPQGGPPGGGDPGARLAEFIKRADADGDGKISKEEFSSMGRKESEERFSKMDANSDGFVDQEEIGKISQMMRRGAEGQGMRRPEGGPPGGSPGGEGGFRRPPGGEGDRPKGPPDGERPRGAPEGAGRPGGPGGPDGGRPGMFGDPKEMFKRMDADANGSVSEEEYIKATEKLREMMRSRGGQPGQPGQPGQGGGFRRPEGGPPGGGGEGGFRRPPTEGDAPKPEGDKPKDPA